MGIPLGDATLTLDDGKNYAVLATRAGRPGWNIDETGVVHGT